ncbi:hypothetical protein PISMIDRAFT_23533 [Pisolithus microcarpus 441]|uniref:Uncharacterized protein n=1 Tax=Pisolithus microcarpus 441 TaxID=765257 RepID=A0A0C9Z278_9AGAM|nr:hypothetical protein PISMIDRAFT_23533 [Pisolithus microcarpus 441]
MATHTVHFIVQGVKEDPSNTLVDILLFLVGLASIHEKKQIQRIAYVMSNDSSADQWLSINSHMVRAMSVGHNEDDSVLDNANIKQCPETVRWMDIVGAKEDSGMYTHQYTPLGPETHL